MPTTAEYIAAGFRKIDEDLAFLMGCLREVLEEVGERAAAAALPWQGTQGPAPEQAGSLEQASSIAFQLLNMVEETAAARTRQLREMSGELAEEPGCWAAELRELAAGGVSAEQVAAALPETRVEPVLTAHPTEAKRASVLDLHRAIYRLLTRLEGEPPGRREALRGEFKIALERLWRSGEILLEKPEVASERRGVLFYLREVFPKALRALDARLLRAWEEAGYPPRLLDDPHAWPRLRFGSWVGGDRDGHPLVTAEVTRETLEEMRREALGVMDAQLRELADELPLSAHFQSPPPTFEHELARLREACPHSADAIARAHPDEPWRQYALLLASRLPFEGNRNSPYHTPDELDEDLARLAGSLDAVGAHRLAQASVWPVRRALDVFGFHLAALDIRQNSAFHDAALGQILRAAGFEDAAFAEWPEEKRVAFLEAELRSPRPFLFSKSGIGAQADAVLACYEVLRDHIERNGRDAIGSLIVSMTRRLSDLLAVYVLAREAGLARWEEGGLASILPVVPLFETLDDLEASSGLVDAFLRHPVTRRSLAFQRRDRRKVLSLPHAEPIQQVMVGYSDSNKDCGILASQWALHEAQARIAAAGREQGVRVRFFHGRGGTISRGAGPTHRFLGALPAGSIQGDLRLTEQGETIAQKYSNVETATYNLELLMAGVAAFSARHRAGVAGDEDAGVWRLLAESSRAAYRGLVDHPRFMAFYSEATPIDALETSRIGSRPARRTGQRTLADLRAIPWVFSWNQSRFYLPGWFGVGSALLALSGTDPSAFSRFRAGLRSSAFSYFVFTNIETNVASADAGIMERYAELVSDAEARREVLGVILEEFRRTGEMLGELFVGGVGQRRPRMLRTLRLRADALRILHERQIGLLAEWRAARASDPHEADRLLPRVLLSVNAIASGLRTTG